MINPNNILQERLGAIGEEYHQQLGTRFNEITILWENARFGTSNSEELKAILKLASNLASSGAPLGYVQIANAAHNLEQFLISLSNSSKKLSKKHRNQCKILIQLLESTITSYDETNQFNRQLRWEPPGYSPNIRGNMPLIFLLGRDDTETCQIEHYLESGGYEIELFSNIQLMRRAISKNRPSLIITAVSQKDGYDIEEELSGDWTTTENIKIPSIYISDNDNLQSRLRAIRLDFSSYFNTPLDFDNLQNKIDELISGIPKDPYRVLIIDDDTAMAGFYYHILEQEGMKVHIIDDPSRSLDVIRNTAPELILINICMSYCSGMDLTKIIRQHEEYTGISIIFLSDESKSDMKMAAINAGGDDFISVPVEPDLIVTAVNSRVSRARTLNALNSNLTTALCEVKNQQFSLDQHAIVSITNINGDMVYVNNNFCNISGYSRSELIGRDVSALNSGIHNNSFFIEMWETINRGDVWQGEVCNKKKNGDLFWLFTTIVPFMDEQNRPYQYVSINSDITSRIFAEQDLLQARDMAINASQAKSEFLSKMSHELRTPLNAILGFTQLLEFSNDKSVSNSSDSNNRYAKEIKQAGEHLLNLINEVLDLSRIEANQLKVDNIVIPLVSFLDECTSLVQPLAQKNAIQIIKKYASNEELAVYADPVRLKQVLLNLLSNAIKYNKPAGTIEISTVEPSDCTVMVNVTDTGDGIADDQIDTLFNPFARLPQHKKLEGVGIGLSISKRLMELMDGDIGVQSEPGKGCRFWIKINSGNMEKADEKTVDKSADDALEQQQHTSTILYIEDNLSNYILVKDILLQRKDYRLIHATTGKSGLEMATKYQPDMILLDLQLPDISGYDIFGELNQLLPNSTPVIAVSADANPVSIKRAIKIGFYEYIAKPFIIQEFLALIDKTISRSGKK